MRAFLNMFWSFGLWMVGNNKNFGQDSISAKWKTKFFNQTQVLAPL